MATTLTVFHGCQKEEQVVRPLADGNEQPQLAAKPDVYVENGYLVFKDYETLNKLNKELNSLTEKDLMDYQSKLGFISAYSYRKELLAKADNMPEPQLEGYLNEVSKKGYFNKQTLEFVYPFFNESYSKILNPEGKLKIGKTYYRFEGTTEIVTPDLTGENVNLNSKSFEKRIELNADLPKLKGGEVLQQNMLSSDQLRCLGQLKRELFTEEGWYFNGSQMIWITMRWEWKVYLRFYSYRQYPLYKSDRPTYFNYKIRAASLGGNFPHEEILWDYNPPRYYRTDYESAIYHASIYEFYEEVTNTSSNPPNVNIEIPEFWSDFMYYVIGVLNYP